MHRERKRERGESARVGVGAREGDRYVETGEVGDGDREGGIGRGSKRWNDLSRACVLVLTLALLLDSNKQREKLEPRFCNKRGIS